MEKNYFSIKAVAIGIICLVCVICAIVNPLLLVDAILQSFMYVLLSGFASKDITYERIGLIFTMCLAFFIWGSFMPFHIVVITFWAGIILQFWRLQSRGF